MAHTSLYPQHLAYMPGTEESKLFQQVSNDPVFHIHVHDLVWNLITFPEED